MDVRIARLGDLEALRDLRLRALADAPDAFGTTYEETVGRNVASFRGYVTGEGEPGLARTWVVDDRGDLRGMARGWRPPDDPAVAYLFGMWVDPALRGTGVAARLVGMVTWWAVAVGAERLVLHVTDGNGRAEAFYARLGFVATDAPHRPLREGSSRTVGTMARSLVTERAGRVLPT